MGRGSEVEVTPLFASRPMFMQRAGHVCQIYAIFISTSSIQASRVLLVMISGNFSTSSKNNISYCSSERSESRTTTRRFSMRPPHGMADLLEE